MAGQCPGAAKCRRAGRDRVRGAIHRVRALLFAAAEAGCPAVGRNRSGYAREKCHRTSVAGYQWQQGTSGKAARNNEDAAVRSATQIRIRQLRTPKGEAGMVTT